MNEDAEKVIKEGSENDRPIAVKKILAEGSNGREPIFPKANLRNAIKEGNTGIAR